MKHLFLVLFLTFCISGIHAQKLKGSKIVTTEQKEIGDFENIEVEDNIEVFLTSGDAASVEIEADDNLHEAIDTKISEGTLHISLNQEITGAKKLSVKITYTDNLKMITAKEDSRVTSLTDLHLDNLTIKAFGNSKIYTTIKSKTFALIGNDKARIEMNLTSDNTTVELSKNAQLKALISTPKLKFDMYQKSSATIEGDASDLKLRLDNSSSFTGKNLTAKTAALVMEGSANMTLIVATSVVIEASGKSDIELQGDPKIELKKFTDSATLRKRPLKA